MHYCQSVTTFPLEWAYIDSLIHKIDKWHEWHFNIRRCRLDLCILFFPPCGCLLGKLLEILSLIMPLHSTEIACLVWAAISSIAPFTIVWVWAATMQIPVVLLAFSSLVSTDLLSVPKLSHEWPFAINGREMYFLLMAAPFIPTSGKSLDLWHVIAESVKIRAVGLKLIQDQSCIGCIFFAPSACTSSNQSLWPHICPSL